MFMQMKSRTYSTRPCPCNNVCLCHVPTSKKVSDKVFVITISLAVFLFMIGILIFKTYAYKSVPKITVRGEICDIIYKEDRRTSASIGHNMAICPSDNKN